MAGRTSRFSGLPATPVAWGSVLLAIVYAVGAYRISQMSETSGLPMLLQWIFGAGVGAVALVLIITALRREERSWLLILGVVIVAFWWLQWMILLVVGFFTGGLWS